jgi:hypothetical protein
MAIVIRGRSVCHICGRVLGADDDIQTFPPSLFPEGASEQHLNDSAVHLGCLLGLPYNEHARQVLNDYIDRLD